MRRTLAFALCLIAAVSWAAPAKVSLSPDPALAGDLTRKKTSAAPEPGFSYARWEESVEQRIHEKRLAQIAILKMLLSESDSL